MVCAPLPKTVDAILMVIRACFPLELGTCISSMHLCRKRECVKYAKGMEVFIHFSLPNEEYSFGTVSA